MNIAQGKPRRLPDGRLHIQNYTVTKESGIAGALFAKVMTKAQQDIVESCLVHQFTKNGYYQGHKGVWDEAHGCNRFPKGFLKARFKPTVYLVFKALNVCPATAMDALLTSEQLPALNDAR